MHNINLVTPEHIVPQVVLAILDASQRGLTLPIVYNTSAFDSLESLQLLDGLVDIYLPDFKVWESSTSRRLLKADDYAAHARKSIRAMHDQVGDLCFTGDGLAKRGVLVRHLVMPGYVEEGRAIMHWLASDEGPGRDCFVNIMEQYRPDAHVGKEKRGTRGMGAVRRADGKEASERVDNREASRRAASDTLVSGPDGKKSDKRYADINRPVTSDEVRSVREAAEAAGLWRFSDPPAHGGWVN